MIPVRYNLLIAVFAAILLISGCSKDTKEDKQKVTDKKEFGWKDGISVADIPDYPLKGSIGGKDIQFQYINFEKWRGSGDNVLVLSLTKPSQPCGYIEDFQGIQLTNKGNSINQGEWVKGKFDDDPKTYQAYFRSAGGDKSTCGFNCALVIEGMDNKVVKGRIALFFNDEKKSWAAGKFEATICNN